MRKSLLLFSLIVAILLIFSTFSFANNDISNGLNNAGRTVKNMINDAGNSIKSGVEDIGNGINNGASMVQNGVNNGASMMQNEVDNGAQNVGNTMYGTSGTSNDGYTATRTSATDGNLMGMSSTSWIWLIFGIVGIVIVALVWYYGSQYENTNNYSNRD